MDPVTLALLGAGLVAALGKLLENVADSAVEKGLEPLREWLTRGYDKAKDEAKLKSMVQKAVAQAAQSFSAEQYGQWFKAFSNAPGLADRFLAAAIEMVADDPARVPADLLRDLQLAEA